MIQNYLKIAFRNLTKNRLFTFLNIAGLSVGLAAGLLMLLWTQDELSFDNFHRDTERIYRENAHFTSGGNEQAWAAVPAPHALYALQEIPEVEKAVRVAADYDKPVFRYGDQLHVEKDGAFTDSSFFEVFKVEVLSGSAAKPFANAGSLVLTESFARKYFDDDDAVGKIMEVGTEKCEVSAVIRDLPGNSIFQYKYFRNVEWLKKSYQGGDMWKTFESNWGDFNVETYYRLRPGASAEAVGTKLADIQHAHNQYDKDSKYSLQPLLDLHLHEPDGSAPGLQTVRILGLAGILLMLIACINYMNLSTARSSGRAREVGLRKVVGAKRGQLLTQFMVETAVVFVIAFGLAMLFAGLLLPWCNEIADKKLRLDWSNPQITGLFGGAMLATLLLSGLYPALVLSAFQPLQTLKGNVLSFKGGVSFRKILVVTQFVFAIGLIVSMLVIGGQLDFMRKKNLGFDRENVFAFGLTGDMMKHREAILRELSAQPGVKAVTSASNNLLNAASSTGDTDWEGKTADQQMIVGPISIAPELLSFFKMELVEGEGFTGTKADSTRFILNEEAARQTGLQPPVVGKRFKLWQTEGVIAGVAKDFHFRSLRQKIGPAVFFSQPRRHWFLYVKTTGQDAAQAVASAETVWKKYESAYPFESRFMDDSFDRMYRKEQRVGQLFRAFGVIAIFISCLGLFGLSAFTAERRIKEIGIRKVLGASVAGITGLLAKDFLKLVFVAIFIASPLAWYLMQKWLSDFAYRIDIQWWTFTVAGLAAVGIAFLTVSFQSVKAALANPARSLKSE